jgi:hypothetical protein
MNHFGCDLGELVRHAGLLQDPIASSGLRTRFERMAAMAAQANDRERTEGIVLPHTRDELKPVDARQRQVGDEEVGTVEPRGLEPFLSVGRRHHLEADAEKLRVHLTRILMIFDEQDKGNVAMR